MKTTKPNTMAGRFRSACVARLLPLLLFLLLPAAVQAEDYTYTTNSDAITITGYTGSGGAVAIPSTINSLPVTSIGVAAFEYCTSLTSVTIPDSVTSIGVAAFFNCTSLTSVTIGDGVTSIGDEAFNRCESLTSVTIGDSVTNIGNEAFEYCTSLTIVTIGNGVTSIGGYAFYSCASLTSVTIGDSVTSIGNLAFASCTSLTSVTIPDSVTSIGDSAFNRCESLNEIAVATSNSAYSSLDGVLFNKGQTTLIQYPGGKAGSYTIPSGVTSIGDLAFNRCASLTSVTIGDSVTSIGGDVFRYCTSLTIVTIGNGVTSIGEYAFYSCASLNEITVATSNSAYSSLDGVLFNKGQTTLIQYPGGKAGSYTIPSGVTSIGGAAFAGCTSLTSIAIPNSVTSIGDSAFAGCTSLTSIAIPDSVTSIGGYAFYSCASLTSVAIGIGVTNLEYEAFSYCTSLTGVYFWGNVPGDGSDTSVFSDDTNATVYYLSGTMGWDTTFDGLSTTQWTGLAVSKLQAKVNFAKLSRDSCSLTATLNLGADFQPNGQTLTLIVGGSQITYSLNKTGAGVYGKSTCRLTHAKGASQWKLAAAWKRGSWRENWAFYSLTNYTIKKPGTALTLPVQVGVAGKEFGCYSPTLHYTAKQNKSGTAK